MTPQEKDLLLGLAAIALADAVAEQSPRGQFKFNALRTVLKPFQDEIRARLNDLEKAKAKTKQEKERPCKCDKPQHGDWRGRPWCFHCGSPVTVEPGV